MFEMKIEIVLWSLKIVLPNVRFFDEIKCLTEIEIVLWSSKNVLPNVRLFDEMKCFTEIEIILWSSKIVLPNVRFFDEINVWNGNKNCFVEFKECVTECAIV